jgi:acetyl-CoA acyltransferase
MEKVVIAGVGMTPFTRSPGRGVRDLAVTSATEALEQAGVPAADVEQIFLGNAAEGVISQQEMIRGEVAFRGSELWGKPVLNIENACASGSSALHLGWQAVTGGICDVVLVVGAEQLTHADKSRTFNALRGSTDIEEIGESVPGQIAANSVLMEFYAREGRQYLEAYDATSEDFARVAVKNRNNAASNPLAQYRKPQTVEEVLGGRMIVEPLTLAMCSPLTDGGAAVVLCSEDYARRLKGPTLTLLASELAGGSGVGSVPVSDAAAKAYEMAGLGPDDFHLIELHDAAAPAELIQYADIGLCDEGEGHHLLRSGATEIGGRIPVNTSGGLLSRGHPLGATGLAQINELWTQLHGRANGRQVEGARTAMAINSGGWLAGTYAIAVATIVQRES